MAINTIRDLEETPSNNVDFLGSDASGAGNASAIDTVRQNLGAIIARGYGDMGARGTVGGSANAITVTSLSTYQVLEAGIQIAFKASAANTGATTLNLDSLGAKAVRLKGDTALSAGHIAANGLYDLIYDEAYNSANGAWVLLNPEINPQLQTIATLGDPGADRILFWDDSESAYKALALGGGLEINDTTLRQYETIIAAVSDETTAITTGTAKVTFRMPFAMTLTAVRASLGTVSSSGTPTFDINEGGVSILSTKLTIDANEKTSTTAATAAVISDASLADDAEITIDIDTAGTGAAGAKVALIGYRA